MENMTPIRIIVLVDKEQSSLQARDRIAVNDRKANSTAMTIVPAKGRAGKVMLKAMAMTAPNAAPEETPRVEPSASGFFKRPCMAAPAKANEAPTKATHITRGRRTVRRMEAEYSSGNLPEPNRYPMPSLKICIASRKGILTLPRQTQAKRIATVITVKRAYSHAIKRSFLCFIFYVSY